jgi:hypothetical protein
VVNYILQCQKYKLKLKLMFYLMNVECMSTLNICQFLILGLLQLAWAGELRRLSIGWSSQWLFCTRTYKQFSLYYSDYCKSCTCIIETGLPINLWKSNDIIKLVIYLRSLWILNLKCHLIQGPASIGTNYTYSRKRYSVFKQPCRAIVQCMIVNWIYP